MKKLRYLGIAVLTALLLWVNQGALWAIPFGGGSDGAGGVVQPVPVRPATPATPAAPTAPVNTAATEIRGVWLTNVDSSVLFSRKTVDQALQQLADYHFNTVYPAVWSWGYTLYPSAVAERVIGYKQGLYPDYEETGRNEELENAQGDRDTLQEVITLAHNRQLSVIPWFEFGFMLPATSPLIQRHPDWLTQKQGSLPGARLYQEGTHRRVWLNPFHPQVQRFILELLGELAANYDIDGLQFDDHFSLPVAFGYDPYTVNLYRQEHGGKSPPTNPEDPEWTRWRADKITNFVDQVFRTVKARRPNAVLSVSPNPAYFAYHYSLQDWPRWRDMGYVEELIVQVYRANIDSFRQTLRDRSIQQASSHIPTGIGILTGLRNAPVPISLIQQQVQTARSMGFHGVSFFFYESLWQAAPGETRGDRLHALEQLFASPRNRTQI